MLVAMGMWMRASAERTMSSGRPAPSLPTSRAMGWRQSTCQGENEAADSSLTHDAREWMPLSLSWVRRMGRDIPATTGRCRAAPAEARRDLGEKGLAVPLWPVAEVTAAVAPNAAAVRRMVPTLPGSCTPARTTRRGAHAPSGVMKRSSRANLRGWTRAATPWGCSVSAMPSKRRSVVRRTGKPTSGRPMKGASRSRWRSPDSLKRTASMRQVERRASSTRRGPSTPTEPSSEGRPPRRAMRNCLSQRLSRLVRRSGEAAGLGAEGIGGRLAKVGVEMLLGGDHQMSEKRRAGARAAIVLAFLRLGG
jgi:hypothetical protein